MEWLDDISREFKQSPRILMSVFPTHKSSLGDILRKSMKTNGIKEEHITKEVMGEVMELARKRGSLGPVPIRNVPPSDYQESKKPSHPSVRIGGGSPRSKDGPSIFGYAVPVFLRTLGRAGWSRTDAKAVIKAMGMDSIVPYKTIDTQLFVGKSKDPKYASKPIAELTPEQWSELESVRDGKSKKEKSK